VSGRRPGTRLRSPEMVEDALDDVGLRDEADDAHAAGAPWADERVDLGLIRALALGVDGLAGDGPTLPLAALE